MKHLFLDTNILIDLLSGREPFGADAVSLFATAQKKQIRLYASGLSLSTCYYIIKRHHPQLDARALLADLLPLLTITDVSATVIRQSLKSEFTDFEDGLQYFSAIPVPEIEAIVTRNPKDFGLAQILILEPGMALAVI